MKKLLICCMMMFLSSQALAFRLINETDTPVQFQIDNDSLQPWPRYHYGIWVNPHDQLDVNGAQGTSNLYVGIRCIRSTDKDKQLYERSYSIEPTQTGVFHYAEDPKTGGTMFAFTVN